MTLDAGTVYLFRDHGLGGAVGQVFRNRLEALATEIARGKRKDGGGPEKSGLGNG